MAKCMLTLDFPRTNALEIAEQNDEGAFIDLFALCDDGVECFIEGLPFNDLLVDYLQTDAFEQFKIKLVFLETKMGRDFFEIWSRDEKIGMVHLFRTQTLMLKALGEIVSFLEVDFE